MSINNKSSSALKKKRHEGSPDRKGKETHAAEIIPWPDIDKLPVEKKKEKKVHLDQKFLYYKGKKIPILQFQKAGYEKLLKLLVKEIKR